MDIQSKLKLEKLVLPSAHNLLLSWFPIEISKNINIKIYRTVIVISIVWGQLDLVTGHWRRLHGRDLHDWSFLPNIKLLHWTTNFYGHCASEVIGAVSYYEGHSKINLRLVGKNKRFVIASKRTLSSNKELLFLLYAYPHTFSPRSVGVNTDKTWTLSSPLPPAEGQSAVALCPSAWRKRITASTSQLAGAAMTVSMFYQYLLLHYAAKMYEGTRTARQKFLVTTERALWRNDNAFIFTNKSEVDFGITLV